MKRAVALVALALAGATGWFVWPLVAQTPVAGQPELKVGDAAPGAEAHLPGRFQFGGAFLEAVGQVAGARPRANQDR